MSIVRTIEAKRADLARLLALPRDMDECQYHGRTEHVLDDEDTLTCLLCERAQYDAMLDAARTVEHAEPEEGEVGYRCPNCGELYDSKCRTPADRVCFECRYAGER